MQIPTFQGIMTVVATPFDRDDAIDFGVLGRHVDWLLGSGIAWIVPGGTTGEYYAQTTDERKRILDFVAEQVGTRAKLAAGTNSVRPDETIELSRHAKQLGYQALMLAPPFYSLPSSGELVEHYRHIAETVELPIILYNFPARAGVDLTREVLEGLASVPAVCAIKESSGSFARMLEHIVYFEDRYQRICGADDQAVDAFLWGSKAFIAGASNFIPAEHVALYEACVVKQDFLLGKKLMHAMMPLFYLLEQGGKYLQYVKYGTELAGFPVGTVRRPLQGLSEEEKANFRRLYEQVKGAGITKLAA